MLLFKKKPRTTAPEHAVILHFELGGLFGTAQERDAVNALEDRMAAAIAAAGAGEVDGNEFGGGEVVVYLYGPDKDRLWAAVEAEVRDFPLRPAFVLLRAGGPDVPPERVEL